MTKLSDLLVSLLFNIRTCSRCQGGCVCPEQTADGKEYMKKEPVVIEQMPQVYAIGEDTFAGLRSHFKIH